MLAIAGWTALGAAEPPAGPGAESADQLTVVAGQLDASRNAISPSLGATTYAIDERRTADQSRGDDAPFNQTLLRAPGVAEDSFGALHVRGEHANLQYRIDGVQLPEGLSGFGQELDTRFAHDTTLITGALPAQYGLRTAGVIEIDSKSGSNAPGGRIGVYGGSHDTVRPSVEYGGAVGRTDAYVTASSLHSSLGIENPTDRPEAIHDDTDQFRGFADVSWFLDSSSRLSVIASGSDARFEIPDNPGQDPAFTLTGVPSADSAKLDERQHEDDEYALIAYQETVATLDYQISGYVRRSRVRFAPDDDGDLIFTGVASRADLHTTSVGGQLDARLAPDERNTLRGGGIALLQRAVSDSDTLVFPVDSSGAQSSSAPRAIEDDQARWGKTGGVYLQDEWKVVPAWTIDLGARFDRVEAAVDEQQLSPRINTTAQVTDSTTLHAGYARYFTPPPLESVPQTTIAKFSGTTNAAAVEQNDPLRAERANYYDAGLSQRFGRQVIVGVDGYYKTARHQLDDGQFGSAIIFTPFNYRIGTVYGSEVTASYQDDDWTAYGNLAASHATGRDIESAQFDFDPDELAYIRDHDVHLDHDQQYTASAGIAYRVVDQVRVLADGLYGSGLRKGFANQERMRKYATLNLGLSCTWHALSARIDVVNVLDRIYELRDGSGIGVGAPQYGERRGVFGGLAYAF